MRGLVAALALVAGVLSPAWPLTDSAKASEGNPIKECLAQLTDRRLAVQFLVDESASLAKSDPGNERLNAMKTALAALAFNLESVDALSDASPIQIDIRMSGFSDKFSVRDDDPKEWTTLSENSLAELEGVIERFGDRRDGKTTNYLKGLEGAEKEFVAYSRRVKAPVCKVLVWLSDGSLDVDNNFRDESPEKKQEDRLCRESQSVVNRLRSQQIYIVGLGLSYTPKPGERKEKKPDFSLMKGIVEEGCGEGEGNGKFTEVADAGGLVSQMFRNLIPGTSPDPVVPCEGEEQNAECREVRFTTRPPLTRVNALVSVTSGIDDASVINPGGSSVTFATAGEMVAVDQGFLKSRPSFDSSTVLRIDVNDANGEWRIQFRGRRAADAVVIPVFFSEVTVKVEGQPLKVDRRSPEPVVVSLGDLGLDGLETDEAVADFDVAPTIDAELRFGDKVLPAQVDADPANLGAYLVRFPAGQLMDLPANGTLVVEPKASLNGHPINFDVHAEPLTLTLGDGFPVVRGVSATPIDGEGKSTITLTLDGPEEGAGRATILGGSLVVEEVPPGQNKESSKITVDSNELVVGAGKSAELVASLSPGFAANGTYVATIEVELLNEAGDRQSTPVTITFEMTKPFDVGALLIWLILMLVVFVAVQGAALWLSADRLSRLASIPDGTRFVTATVRLSSDGNVSLVTPNEWAQVAENSRLIDSTQVAGRKTVSFGAFRVFGSPRLALRSLLLGVPYSPQIESGSSLVLSTSDPVNRQGLTGGIQPQLVGQWAVAIPRESASVFVRPEVTPSEATPEFDAIFGGGLASDRREVVAEYLYILTSFDGEDLVAEGLKVSEPLVFGSAWSRAVAAFSQVIEERGGSPEVPGPVGSGVPGGAPVIDIIGAADDLDKYR